MTPDVVTLFSIPLTMLLLSSPVFTTGTNQNDISNGCPKLTHPPNGFVALSGCGATYSCHENYSLDGDSHLVCCNNNWTGTIPSCVRVCLFSDFPGVMTNPAPGAVSTPKSASRVILTCPEGYLPIDGSNRTCTENGEWYPAPLLVQCEKECPQVEAPKDGSVLFTTSSAVIYFCKFGFQLVGSPERRCVNGDWTGAEPFCLNQTQLGRRIGLNAPLALQNNEPVNTLTFLMSAAPSGGVARRSVSFFYRAKAPSEGVVNMAINVSLLNAEANDSTVTEKNITILLSGSAQDNSEKLAPVCIELTSTINRPFRSKIQVKVEFPKESADAAVEIRDLEASRSQRCTVRDGECPFVANYSRCGTFCRHDGNCDENQKCCITSCGVDCLDVLPDNSTANTTTISRKRRTTDSDTDGDFDCDNTTDSGDCGYKGSACSSDNEAGSVWQVVANESANGGDELTKLDLTAVDLRRDCDFDVCIDCLYQEADSEEIRERRRATFRRTSFSLPQRSKSFCIFDRDFKVVFDMMRTDLISGKKKIARFKVRMLANGFHHMIVRLFCSDSAVAIRLKSSAEFSIPHFDYNKEHDHLYEIEVEKMIKESRRHGRYHGRCPQYRLEFQIALILSPACVDTITFY